MTGGLEDSGDARDRVRDAAGQGRKHRRSRDGEDGEDDSVFRRRLATRDGACINPRHRGIAAPKAECDDEDDLGAGQLAREAD